MNTIGTDIFAKIRETAAMSNNRLATNYINAYTAHSTVECAIKTDFISFKSELADMMGIDTKKFNVILNVKKIFKVLTRGNNNLISGIFGETGSFDVEIFIAGPSVQREFSTSEYAEITLSSSISRNNAVHPRYDDPVYNKTIKVPIKALGTGKYKTYIIDHFKKMDLNAIKTDINNRWNLRQTASNTANELRNLVKIFNKFPCTLRYDPSNVSIILQSDGTITIEMSNKATITKSEYTNAESLTAILTEKLGLPAGTIELSQF